MKNVTSIKSVKTESPKTPGGISKSLLTPCRRVGLSRNWKKVGPSPFVSPLAGSSTPSKEAVQPEKKPSRKRKERVESEDQDEEKESTPGTQIDNDGIEDVDESVAVRSADKDEDLMSTPIRHIEVPRKKKSKTLLSAIKCDQPKEPITEKPSAEAVDTSNCDHFNKSEKEQNEMPVTPLSKSKSKGAKSKSSSSRKSLKTSKEKLTNNLNDPLKEKEELNNVKETEHVVTPVQKSESKPQDDIPVTKTCEQPEPEPIIDVIDKENIINEDNKEKINEEIETTDNKTRSPNELTKECIVVIQKKIFKTDKKQKEKAKLQPSDSDSDDVPLGLLSKEKAEKIDTSANLTDKPVETPDVCKDIINLVDEEEDFIETKKPKVKKLEDKSTSIGGLKKKTKSKQKPQPKIPIPTQDFDDEDDFDFDNKKTILIRKTYEKVNKPQKAKSTGSITQKDIDELRARIEVKKKMLLARAMTEDTEELRSLIKKWQRGCQDALMELMELMKTKFADRPNMDYSEMLSMLKIPQTLVGYDAENDCFVTPDDATIVLSKFNDL